MIGDQRRALLFLAILATGVSHVAIAAQATWTVNSCAEGTSGSGTTGTLRYAVANAASGDIVDMTTLPACVISLETGSIKIGQSALTLNGPGRDKLTISRSTAKGAMRDRILYHSGTGTLTLKGVSISRGLFSTNVMAEGGCVLTKGSLSLNGVSIDACEALSSLNGAAGGAVYVTKQLEAKYSTISNSSAVGAGTTQFPFANFGGGAAVGGDTTLKYSTIKGNSVRSTAALGINGGLSMRGNVTIVASTISENDAQFRNGGLGTANGGANSKFNLYNSTVSGNTAYATAGIYTNAQTVTLKNSCVVNNVAASPYFATTYYKPYSGYVQYTYAVAPGLEVAYNSPVSTITLQSSIIANNYYRNGDESDLQTLNIRSASPPKISGNNNLIGRPNTTTPVPTDTIIGICPSLGPLRNNGGSTFTHALFSNSPAIDTGNNAAAFSYDQRGNLGNAATPSYPRVSGIAADIGAYEVQRSDVIFSAGFDGCAYLF
jgi:hypothetical protein